MNIKKISKPYWNSGNKDALAVIIPKMIRESLDIDDSTYISWEMTLNKEGEIVVTFDKV